ncbi:MAG: 2-oxoglutarate dehydrogenase, E2 component, dihydrolipoamide succinyltransferase, partial [Chloroflexi bacterium]|nr:2-oxoglutarate dehydrogenase, E2 component, dihydrolipoamide succinyltransferase [Chloroflexota bacterium]
LTMPNIGEGVTEGEIVRWLKQLGDAVARDEPVVEIETDKAIVEIPSPFEGTLTSILVAEGETVPIGAAIAEITAAGDEAPEAGAPEAAPPTPT